MSIDAFQKSLATLVRFPELSFDSVLAGLEPGSLTDQERYSLSLLSRDPLVRKFGNKMQFLRQREAQSVMRLSLEHLPQELLNILYLEHFEPSRLSSDPLWVGVEFLNFLINYPVCRDLLIDSPPYVIDLIKYDHAKAYATRHVPVESDSALPENSLLNYGKFVIVSLGSDVPTYDRAKWNGDVGVKHPLPKDLTMLFLPSHNSPFYRTFQIDEEVASFLATQRENPSAWNRALPSHYAGMVKIGLCKETVD
ncbi:hypothetical protein K2X33_06870 [bacterium]|nr:hypothetical protein [bacterium]